MHKIFRDHYPMHFFRIALGLTFAAACGASTYAQRHPYTIPQFDASGAFSYVRGHDADNEAFDLLGGNIGLNVHLRRWLAIAGDGGAYRFRHLGPGLTSTMYTYAGGPRLTFPNRGGRIKPFAQVLIGGAHLSASSGKVEAAENSFLFLPGAGIDVAITHVIAIRAIQVDYLYTRFAQIDGSSGVQHNLRVSAGVVFRFGSR